MTVVLITGCSSGLGLEAAVAFARAGDIVYASVRDVNKADRLRAVCHREGVSLEILQLDVTRPDTFPSVIADVLERSGRLDVLVNNAGVLPIGAFEEVSPQHVRAVMEANFFGPALLTRAALPTMRRQNQGYVIMVSSLSGLAATAGDALYAASKFALEGLTEGLRNEVARWNIKTALVEPAGLPTDLFRAVATSAPDDQSPYRALTQARAHQLAQPPGDGFAVRDVAELLVHISRSDGSRLRWPAGDAAERIATTLRTLSDADRDAYLRSVADVDWWVEGRDEP